MSFRVLLTAVLAFAWSSAMAAVPSTAMPNAAVPKPAVPKPAVLKPAALKPRSVPMNLPEPPMQFYVVKGAPDACGRGCDSWIAIEGKIDSTAAARFRKFLAVVRGRNLPLYFYSPGGSVEQALAMGAMLREKPVVARVGRTIVNECGFEAQNGEACIKLKQSGRELHGDVLTRGAFCGSACPYLMLGAPTREVAADAELAVHSARVTVSFHGPEVPPAEMIAAANANAHERSDHMIAAYLAKMGADPGLLALIRTVKFEQMHILTREEIARFGIDRREFVETPWTYEVGTRAMVHKVALQRRDGEKTFRTTQWRVICLDTDHFELDFLRPSTPVSVLSSVSISSGGASVLLFHTQAKLSDFEVWGTLMHKAFIQSFSAASQTELAETLPATDGHKIRLTQMLSTDGFADALNRLVATCPAPKAQQRQTVEVHDHAAK